MKPEVKTMRVGVLREVGDIAIEERAVPQPGPREVQVQVTAVGVCGSDVHYFEHGRIGDFVVESPLVLGHEPAGVVTAVGSDVTRCSPGDRVSVEPGVPCFTCAWCRGGRYNLCTNMRFFATPPIDGAFAEYVVQHEAMVHPVPDEVSDEAAAMLEPLSVGIWACEKARVSPGSRVLITGSGPVGLMALQAALARGAGDVLVTDIRPARRRLAVALGAHEVADPATDPDAVAEFEPDVLIECSGSGAATLPALRALQPAGRAVLVGMGGTELTIPLSHIQNREIEVTGTFRYANTWPVAVSLAASGRIELDSLVSDRFGLEASASAMTAVRGPEAIKVMVCPQE